MEKVKVGLLGKAELLVKEKDTAAAHGSGGLAVFATPALVALMEKAAWSSVETVLSANLSTVGVRLEISHLAATPVGLAVTASSELVNVDGKKLEFRVQAHDSTGLIGEGLHQRVIIEKEKFMAKVAAKNNI